MGKIILSAFADKYDASIDKTFDNLYKYENQQVAFLNAIKS